MKVLLVADSPWVVNQTRSALGGSHDIVEVSDPYEAEAVSMTAEADVVLIDMQVGSMGGMAITRTIKGVALTGEAPDSPIILLLDRTAGRVHRQEIRRRCLAGETVHFSGFGGDARHGHSSRRTLLTSPGSYR